MSKALCENIIEGCGDCDFSIAVGNKYYGYYFKCHHPYSSVGKIDSEYVEDNTPHPRCPLRTKDYSLKLNKENRNNNDERKLF